METLLIQVDCRTNNRETTPQLGITVEAPYSSALNNPQRLQQVAGNHDYRNHDYQNLDAYDDYPVGTKTSNNNKSLWLNSTSATKPSVNNFKQQLLGEHTTKQSGLQITQIQPNSVIDRCRQFKVGDIIVEVNGISLQRCTFQEAQRTLKEFVNKHSSHAPLLLKVLRRSASSSSIPSTTGSQATVIERNLSPSSSNTTPKKSTTSNNISNNNNNGTPSPKTSNAARHLVGPLNTRKIGTKYHIPLTKSKIGGFGIKIAERDNMYGQNRPIYITAITTSGSAYRDGRLKEGDMLLAVNGVYLSGKSQSDVTRMLKAVGVNETVEFVVSRQEDLPKTSDYNRGYVNTDNLMASHSNGCDTNQSLIDLDDVFSETSNHQFEKKVDSLLNVPKIDGPGNYIYDIPINNTNSAGLGLYLKYPTLDRKDLGIWIKNVITGGAAWKDGRLQPDDQILAINGISLTGLTNAEASETLTAAVSRGIGPEAAPNTIRLNIHRRDPAVVAKILLGGERSANNTQESFQTDLDTKVRSQSSSNDTTTSSSNHNSHNDSALSPQTQASSSLKITNSSTDKTDLSEKTNDTTSAISQITDSTTVPINENSTSERELNPSNAQAARTHPKTLESDNSNQTSDVVVAGAQSWDELSVSSAAGEEPFQRDGFGRQSISEKRHAQIMAQTTDTFKRNQKLREERERQRRLEQQMERQRLDDGPMPVNSHVSTDNNQIKMVHSVTTPEVGSLYNRNTNQAYDDLIPREDFSGSYHREVPVDVHVPYEPSIQVQEKPSGHIDPTYSVNHYISNPGNLSDHHMMQHRLYNQQQSNLPATNQCHKCGLSGQCICFHGNQIQQDPFYGGVNYGFDPGLKRSNSLESIQQPNQLRDGLIIPRSGTVRVARNRRINESFRAAVDRSYDSSVNNSIRLNHSSSEPRPNANHTKISNSVCNSTTSTFNEERYLINNTQSNNVPTSNCNGGHKKSSSLLTKFLKFGSMKRSKKKNKDSEQLASAKASQDGGFATTGREHHETRSQNTKGSHSRTQSSQSNPKNNSQNFHNPLCPSSQSMTTSKQHQLQVKSAVHFQNSKQAMPPNRMPNNNIEMLNQPHSGAQMYPYHTVPDTRFQSQQSNIQPYVARLNMAKQDRYVTNRPTTGIVNSQQYSHLPMHHQHIHHHHQDQHQLLHQPMSRTQPMPADIHNQQAHYQSLARNPIVHQTPLVNASTSFYANNSQWPSNIRQAPNGLWVTNSPPTENIYGVHGQPQPQMISLHNQHQPATLPHPTPFMPALSSGSTNGSQHMHQAAIIHQGSQLPSMTQQHNQQPQHIYYYDF